MHVDRVRADGVGLELPDLHGYRLARHHRRGALQENFEDVELDLGEVDCRAGGAEGSSGRVVDEVAHRQLRRMRLLRPALQGAQPGEQLGEIEGLDHVVVGALVKAEDTVGGHVPSRQHEHGDAVAPAPDRPQDLDPAHDGHSPVEYGHLVVVSLQVRDGLRSVGDGVDDIAGSLESPFQHGAESLVVLGHEDPHEPPFYWTGPVHAQAGA